MTSEQFTWLCAYARVEPFGYEMENFRAGIVASTVARVNGSKLNPRDFYPKVNEPVDVDSQSQEEQIRLLIAASGNNRPN